MEDSGPCNARARPRPQPSMTSLTTAKEARLPPARRRLTRRTLLLTPPTTQPKRPHAVEDAKDAAAKVATDAKTAVKNIAASLNNDAAKATEK